jgi:hypothetical protein
MKLIQIAVCLLTSLSLYAQSLPGTKINLDGIVSAAEWDNGKKESFTGGGHFFLNADEKHVYIGIQGLKEGWTHVYIFSNETVHILHASAALSSVSYKKESGKFQPKGEFQWEMRNTSLDDEARAERVAYLEKYGWVASTHRMGNKNEFEIIIRKDSYITKEARLAIVFASDAKNPQFWPATLNDDCTKEELVYGKTIRDLGFVVDKWSPIEF